MYNMKRLVAGGLMALAFLSSLYAQPKPSTEPKAQNVVEQMQVDKKPHQTKFVLTFKDKVPTPLVHFQTKHDESYVFDFADTLLNLSRRSGDISSVSIKNYQWIFDGTRSRLLVYPNSKLKLNTEVKGKQVTLTFVEKSHLKSDPQKVEGVIGEISAVNVLPTAGKSARLELVLTNPNLEVDVTKHKDRVVLSVPKASINRKLPKQIPVKGKSKFITDVRLSEDLSGGQVAVKVADVYQYASMQSNNRVVITLTPKAEAPVAQVKKQKRADKISLNFQDIKVRSALQLIADFTGRNIVVSDTVSGSLTLRLNNVPWEEALNIILQTRGLGRRDLGSIMLIAPRNEIAEREARELEEFQKARELTPLASALIEINYAKAADLAKLLKTKETHSLLSERGNVSVDERTNILWVQDTEENLRQVRHFIKRLDVPVRQVLIEARIVSVNKTFGRDMGIKFGVSKPGSGLSGSFSAANDFRAGTASAEVGPDSRLNVDLAAGSATTAGKFGLALARLGKGVLLDMELSALESENKVDIVSSPRLLTANQHPAFIESGEDIPYLETTSSGAASIAFKKAALSLKVTPQITPDKRIILDLQVNNDQKGGEVQGTPIIITEVINTKVLVNDSETIVLGGIFKTNKENQVSRVPFLGNIPLLGNLFKNTKLVNNRKELVIFITPKVVRG